LSIREVTFSEAICEAIKEEMRKDGAVFIIGEDVRSMPPFNSLRAEFGDERVIDAPIAESGFTGAAVGAAITGMKPIVYHGRCDFMLYAYDSIANQAAKWRFQTGHQSKLNMVIVAGTGGYSGSGCHHSQSLESMFLNVPGISLAVPSNPYDAKGLLKTAMKEERPVIYFIHVQLRNVKGAVPENDYSIPFGKASVKREGEDATIVATALMVHKALNAAEGLEKEGVSVEVLDPRTLVPLDLETMIDSVRKTGRLITVEEGCRRGGFGAEVVTIVAEKTLNSLKAPPVRVANPNAMIPYKAENEAHVLPQAENIKAAVMETVSK
jgi:pyruvate dehydrogenase E1 component beta subunit